MADISKITLANGATYNIKDAVARSISAGAIRVIGKTTTVLSDDATTNPIMVNGESVTATANNAVFYGKKEFIFDGTKWHEFGDMTGVGALAMKDYATATYTPEGDVSQPTFTGSVLTSTGLFTPTGGIVASENNEGNYQPAGTVSAPTIRLKTAGSTEVVNSITDVGTLPTLTLTVNEEAESLTISFDRGTLPTKGNSVTVKTTDAVYESTVPLFTGTKVQIDFDGNTDGVSVTGTPIGSVSKPSFTGTEATITVT